MSVCSEGRPLHAGGAGAHAQQVKVTALLTPVQTGSSSRVRIHHLSTQHACTPEQNALWQELSGRLASGVRFKVKCAVSQRPSPQPSQGEGMLAPCEGWGNEAQTPSSRP